MISETIKERTVLQIKTALQKKAYEEAGIQVQNSVSNNKIMQGVMVLHLLCLQHGPYQGHARCYGEILTHVSSGQSGASSAEVTLNALNASESEVSVTTRFKDHARPCPRIV